MARSRSNKSVKLEHQSRRVFGQQGTDFQEGVNFTRLREERLGKLQEAMKAHDLAALLLTQGDNIRYATGTWDFVWRANSQCRYCLVFESGQPILFETVGEDTECVKLHTPWLADRIRPAITYLFAEAAFDAQLARYAAQIQETLKEAGLNPGEDQLGVDTMDFITHEAFRAAGIRVVSGAQAIKKARLTKTQDELELLKIACSVADACFWRLREEWVEPGVREVDVAGKITDFFFSHGFQMARPGAVASGCNTNPYLRGWTDKVINRGDMVIIDLAGENYMGYSVDYVRCWPVCAPFTREQKEVYKECYESMYAAMDAIKPGATTADVARAFPPYADDEYKTCSLIQFGHSTGISHYEGYWISRGFSLDYPMPIEENMFFAIETYAARPGGVDGARLEENVVVTETGYEVFSRFPFEEEAMR
ncbi:MAG: M24 family metallopeptidase [Nitrospinota bacterium]